ncbi:LacI family DNA-binding transcriptional regulator [Demequina aurantiaca]|uniref:LacI family DNA-binding transcriptional regulator n=1 Tax=Demequina aurantiaca TaxID=676200 RepID=UPI000AED1145|nr:LacI family DNA-binding transcriptional regulator [Demequina aurantiaca]
MAMRKPPSRPTIAEIAKQSGVSAGAVSYALNGRPGVSDETRKRILEVAREVGWVPSTAARALRGGGTATLGLVITREPDVLGIEPFFMSFVAGIEKVISARGYALLLQVTPDPERELQTYREWWSARRVDGIFVTDLAIDDQRLPIINEIGLPVVVVGDPAFSDGLPAVGSDDAAAANAAMERLAELGHKRVAHIAGPERFVHTHVRSDAMARAGERLGIQVVAEVNTDYSVAAGTAACHQLLDGANPPTAMVFDNDLTAIGAVRAATGRGVEVPGQLSVLAWDDSPLCELTVPALSALSRDVSAYGADAATMLLNVVNGSAEVKSVRSSVARLVDRGTLGPAPR